MIDSFGIQAQRRSSRGTLLSQLKRMEDSIWALVIQDFVVSPRPLLLNRSMDFPVLHLQQAVDA